MNARPELVGGKFRPDVIFCFQFCSRFCCGYDGNPRFVSMRLTWRQGAEGGLPAIIDVPMGSLDG